MTIPDARAEARKLIAAFTDTVKNDGGPRTPGHPMDAFAAEFPDRQARHWKPATRAPDQRTTLVTSRQFWCTLKRKASALGRRL